MKLWLLVLLALASGVAAEPLCSPSKPTPIASGTYGTPRTPQVVRAWQLGRQFDRVLIVVLENMDYGNSIAQPYFKELAARGTLLTRYSGNFHPSYPNYLARPSVPY